MLLTSFCLLDTKIELLFNAMRDFHLYLVILRLFVMPKETGVKRQMAITAEVFLIFPTKKSRSLPNCTLKRQFICKTPHFIQKFK